MKKTCLLSILALVASTSAWAGPAAVQALFGSLEGEFQGAGTLDQLDASGNHVQQGYEVQIQVTHPDDNRWVISNSITMDSGQTLQNSAAYVLNGDVFLLQSGGTSEPVQVTDSSAFSLTYQFERVDFVTGQRYVITPHIELDATRQWATGATTVALNGVTISTDNFSAKRW